MRAGHPRKRHTLHCADASNVNQELALAVRLGLAAECAQLQHGYATTHKWRAFPEPWHIRWLTHALIFSLPCNAADQGVGHVQQQGTVAIVDHGPAHPDPRTQTLSVGGFELSGVSISGQVRPASASNDARAGACAATQGPRIQFACVCAVTRTSDIHVHLTTASGALTVLRFVSPKHRRRVSSYRARR